MAGSTAAFLYIAAPQLFTHRIYSWGVDPSAGMLAAAQQRYPVVGFKSGFAEKLPLTGGCFDLVHGHIVPSIPRSLPDRTSPSTSAHGSRTRGSLPGPPLLHLETITRVTESHLSGFPVRELIRWLFTDWDTGILPSTCKTPSLR